MTQTKLILLLFLIPLLSFSIKASQALNHPSPPQRTLQSCEPGCLTCSSSEVCTDCEATRVLIDSKCRCKPPRILRDNTCQCPWEMEENPTTKDCEYIDLLDVVFKTSNQPFFYQILQVQMNPRLKWEAPPTFKWEIDCDPARDFEAEFLDYLSTQKTDTLLIPSRFLDLDMHCNANVSYQNQNAVEISKEFVLQGSILSPFQLRIVGGNFQMLNYAETNVILAESSNPEIPWSQLNYEWSQRSGDGLEMSTFLSSSNPFTLTIPKCTLFPGKTYSFGLTAGLKGSTLSISDEITVGVHSPKIHLGQIETEPYHIYSQDLTLTASQFLVEDKCNQLLGPQQFLDLLNVEYTWECFIVDPDSTRRLLNIESTEITEDSNVQAHPDPQNIFYRSSASDTITIPSSYFTDYKGYHFIIYLTVTAPSNNKDPSIENFNLLRPTLNVYQTKVSIEIVDSEPFTSVSFSCSNENNCQAFSSDLTKFTGLNYDPNFTYTWLISTFSATTFSNSYKNWAVISSISSSQRILPQIILQVTDGTNVASSLLTLPLQTPIKQGSLYIYPSSGEAYNTNFFISTYLSTSDDLPISFQFLTTCGGSDPNLMLQKYEPFDSTPILLPPEFGGCGVGVQMANALGLYTTLVEPISLTGRSMSLSETLQKNALTLDLSKSSTNLQYRLRLISLMMENLYGWEITDDPDLTLNITSSELKHSLITEMRDILKAYDSRNDVREIMLNNIKWASNQLFNQDTNWKLYMSILDDCYQANSGNSILNPTEYRTFAAILDNLMYYMKKPGNLICSCDTVLAYTNTLIKSALSNLIPADSGFNYAGTFYALLTMKTTYCKVLEDSTRLPYYDGMTVNFNLKSGKTIAPEQCNDQLDLVFMAFREEYIVKHPNRGLTLISLDLKDSITGKSVLNLYDFAFFTSAYFCPEGFLCTPEPDGRIKISGLYYPQNQIEKIFDKSTTIIQRVNSSAQTNFKILEGVAFWTVIGFSICFFASLYWFSRKNSTYCALKSNKNVPQKSLFKKINLLFWLVHPLTGIFLYNDPKINKAARLAIYYQRVLVVMLFSAIFSYISEREETILGAYIILFNILTALPINSLLSRISSSAFKVPNFKKKEDHQQSLAVLFYLFSLPACLIVIFVIETQHHEESWNKTWGINFAISFVQDLILSHLISLTVKLFLLKFSQAPQKLMAFLLQNFKPIYTSIFRKIPIPIETQTEMASPMSTSRKLLKLTTLDSSPTLPKSPTKRAFRTRRVSDTEMDNVDSVAAETLVTERFQILFSEGKTERLKENSPVKQNYEKMQSASISSARFLSPRSPTNPNGLSINYESKSINRSIILLSPSGPEDGLFSSIPSPRDGSSPKLFDNAEPSTTQKETERCQTTI